MALEITGPSDGLLDDPLDFRLRGGGTGAVRWRGRVRDDLGFVWRAEAASAAELPFAWTPAKASAPEVMALRSLRPVQIDLRAELPEGGGASRTVTRRFAGAGVKVRRWRDASRAVLHLPAGDAEGVLLVVGTSEAAALAAPLLAARGVVVLLAEGDLDLAREQLARVPAAAGLPVLEQSAEALVVPAGVGVRDEAAEAARDRAARWKDLSDELRSGRTDDRGTAQK